MARLMYDLCERLRETGEAAEFQFREVPNLFLGSVEAVEASDVRLVGSFDGLSHRIVTMSMSNILAIHQGIDESGSAAEPEGHVALEVAVAAGGEDIRDIPRGNSARTHSPLPENWRG